MSLLLVAAAALGCAGMVATSPPSPRRSKRLVPGRTPPTSQTGQEESYGADPCSQFLDLVRESGEWTPDEVTELERALEDHTDPDLLDTCADEVAWIKEQTRRPAVTQVYATRSNKGRT